MDLFEVYLRQTPDPNIHVSVNMLDTYIYEFQFLTIVVV